MAKSKRKLFKILISLIVMVIVAVIATIAWFYFTLEPTLTVGDFQALEYGSLKLSATEDGPDIGMNGEIELDINGSNDELYPGSSGSLTVWITSDTADIVSYILTYTEAAPNTDESLYEAAKEISSRHILFFKTRTVESAEPVLDTNGNPVYDEDGEQVINYTYSYSDPLYPVGEYTENDELPAYKVFGALPFNTPTSVTVYWVWPYDYAEYGKYGSYEFLFPAPEEGEEAIDDGLTDEERYDSEDSFIGKVVQYMRFRFYVNGKRSIVGLE